MSRMFARLITESRRISRDDFALNFGGIADDVVGMLSSDEARQAVRDAREAMEAATLLPSGAPRLRQVDFGLFSSAPELEEGQVAAVDGTTALPIQLFSAGQALAVGIGSLTHRRPLEDTLHFWSSQAFLREATNTDDLIARSEQGMFGISQTAYLRYFETRHAIEIDEPIVFFDGTVVYEWLAAIREGVQLYLELFNSGKQVIGVMKNVKANAVFATFARALNSGEIYVIETLQDHLTQSNAPNRNHGEGGASRYTLPAFHEQLAPHILRGVFKPRKKAFGFEVHEDHLESMLRVMAADCQLNMPGHEIPYLLNRVDEAIKRSFSPRILKERIAARMIQSSEELFFGEANERDMR